MPPWSDSLPEVHSTIPVPTTGWWRKLLAFSGPGFLVAVGYMDPGNWATDLEGGAKFGYALLFVVFLSNLVAVLLQSLSLKLGIASNRDLAQACREHYSPRVSLALWILCEIAIAACDLAEVIGSAIALNLLFGLPLVAGILITGLDVLLVLYLQEKGFRRIEVIVASLIAIIGACFCYELLILRPVLSAVLTGFVPTRDILGHREMLYLGIAILGATVMPHNLYLHSSIVQTRRYLRNEGGRREAIGFASLDSALALFLAFLVNAAILILSAGAFFGTAHSSVADIADAYKLLSPAVGNRCASTLFAVALLASGQNATLTGTLAGQIVMEGFVDLRLKPWLRRLITRGLAIVPALIAALYFGARGTGKLLVLSQVVLSFQLSFAVFPLVRFTADRKFMGEFVNSRPVNFVAYAVAIGIAGLNLYLVFQFFKP